MEYDNAGLSGYGRKFPQKGTRLMEIGQLYPRLMSLVVFRGILQDPVLKRLCAALQALDAGAPAGPAAGGI